MAITGTVQFRTRGRTVADGRDPDVIRDLRRTHRLGGILCHDSVLAGLLAQFRSLAERKRLPAKNTGMARSGVYRVPITLRLLAWTGRDGFR
jgi:hypothetical protein